MAVCEFFNEDENSGLGDDKLNEGCKTHIMRISPVAFLALYLSK